MSPLSIILLSPVKKSSRLNQERNMQRSSTVSKRKQPKTVLNKYVGDFDLRGQKGMDFLMEAMLLWIMNYIFWPKLLMV